MNTVNKEGRKNTHTLQTRKEMNICVWRPSMRQDKYTYNLGRRRQGQVEYSEHEGRTKHPHSRDKEANGGLSM